MHIPKAFWIFILMWSALSCESVNDSWAVKIDDEVITIDEFNNFYYTQNKIMFNLKTNEEVDQLASEADTLSPQMQQYIVKSSFLDSLVAQKLLYNKAIKDTQLDQKELKTTLELSRLQTAASYYVANKLRDQIQVTDEEVEEFYTENRSMFRGVPLNESVINRIKQQILLQKSSIASNQYVMELIAESKINKEGFKKYMQTQREKEQKETESQSQQPAKAEK